MCILRVRTHFVSFRNSQIELRLPTVRRPKNKNPRLGESGRARGGFYGPLNKVRFSCGKKLSFFSLSLPLFSQNPCWNHRLCPALNPQPLRLLVFAHVCIHPKRSMVHTRKIGLRAFCEKKHTYIDKIKIYQSKR